MKTEALIQDAAEFSYSDALRHVPPDTVRIDARGNSIYQSLDGQARERLRRIMAKLAQRREATEKQV